MKALEALGGFISDLTDDLGSAARARAHTDRQIEELGRQIGELRNVRDSLRVQVANFNLVKDRIEGNGQAGGECRFGCDGQYVHVAARSIPCPIHSKLARTPWRVGRRVGRNLYVQLGARPSDDDPVIGQLDTPELARVAVECHNAALEAGERRPALGPERLMQVCETPGCGAVIPDARGQAPQHCTNSVVHGLRLMDSPLMRRVVMREVVQPAEGDPDLDAGRMAQP